MKPSLLGPVSLLWLGKAKGNFDKLTLLPKLLQAYQLVIKRLEALGCPWIQLEEPIIALDLSEPWQDALRICYEELDFSASKCLLVTYFGSVEHQLDCLKTLKIDGLHLQATELDAKVEKVIQAMGDEKIISLGIIDGRNIWRADLQKILTWLKPWYEKLGDRLWLAPSCSLMHVPIDLDLETHLAEELKAWLAFAKQKLEEVVLLSCALRKENVQGALGENEKAQQLRQVSPMIHNPRVKNRMQECEP